MVGTSGNPAMFLTTVQPTMATAMTTTAITTTVITT